MEQKDNDEFSMLKDVQSLFNNPVNAAKIATIAAIVSAKGELDAHITLLDSNKVISDADNKGIRLNKDDLREAVADRILDIAGPLANLGRVTNDNVLKNRYKVTKSELMDMRANDLVTFATQTITDANANLPALLSSGITAANVTALTNASAAFQLIIASPGQAIQMKKVANENIKATFPLTRELIDTGITPLMRTNFFASDPDFYRVYLASTLITTTGVRHYDFFGQVIDSTTGAFVQKVKVAVVSGDGAQTPIASDETGPKGRFQFKEIPQGTYIVILSRPGYQTLEIPGIVIIDGVATKKTFTIVPV
jgi:hypothetical protein